MANWIKGEGFYYIQPTGPIDTEANRKRLDQVEIKLQEAEERFGFVSKVQSA